MKQSPVEKNEFNGNITGQVVINTDFSENENNFNVKGSLSKDILEMIVFSE